MFIKYRAIHARVPWKRVGTHETLHGAIDGDKGAKNVLLGIGEYVQKLWAERGEPSCIFVWEQGSQLGFAFRISPLHAREIQTARIPVDLLEQYDKVRRCPESEIEHHFRASSVEPSVASAIEDADAGDTLSAMEGAVHEARVLSRGRNRALRSAALKKASGTCEACSVVFSDMFGGAGSRVLQVHHRQQLALREVPTATSLEDLAVVCANCHALIHMDPKHALKVEQLQVVLAARADV